MIHVDLSLSIAVLAVIISVWSVLYSIRAQSRLARVQGSEIHRKRADVVEDMLRKYRAYVGDMKAFIQAKDSKTYSKHVSSGGKTLVEIYHRFAENDLFFTPMERTHIYKGADALETAHRLLRELFDRYWQIKDQADPKSDARMIAIEKSLEERAESLKRDMTQMHGVLMKLIGLK